MGIATDAKDRLANGHGLNTENGIDKWMLYPAESSVDARVIEQYYLDAGLDGGSGGGNDSTTQVYICFKGSNFR